MKKLTKEIVNERIIDRGIELISDYNGNNIKAEFQCKYGHKWFAGPGHIMNGMGCPICSTKMVADQKRFSKDIVNERLQKSDRGIELIGEYISNKIKAEFQCKYGHKWLSIPGNIMAGGGCPSCSTKALLSKDIVNERLQKSGRDIRQVGEYSDNKTKTEFWCKCGHIWLARPKNIIDGQGCPECADYGFNPGKSAWIYILIFDSFIKYGITNNLENRLHTHTRMNGEYTIAFSKEYSDGSIARKWESSIKIIFGGSYVTKDICPDGYTETLSRDKLQALLDTII